MIHLFSALVLVLSTVAGATAEAGSSDDAGAFDRLVRPFLTRHCVDCHFDSELGEAGLDLAQFETAGSLRDHLPTWKVVYDQIDTYAMPPGDEEQPSAADRRAVLDWIERKFAAEGAGDAGHRVLRRLTRLEYNNTVRDLFGLSIDVFMFPERLPIDPQRFDPVRDRMPDRIEIAVREYGQKYPVLLRQAGLPGDGRAEHGFQNRGDVMNVSPLLLDEYVTLAGQIVGSPQLPVESEAFHRLIEPPVSMAPAVASDDKPIVVRAKPEFSADAAVTAEVSDDSLPLAEFRGLLAEAVGEGVGGVFDGTIGDKGATLKAGFPIQVGFGETSVRVVSEASLWSAGFGSAEEASRPHLLTNHDRGRKRFVLALSVPEQADRRITCLAVVVPARKGETGQTTLTARLQSGRTIERSHRFDSDSGNVAFTFRAPSEDFVTALEIDGSNLSGDYVLFDDLAFVTGAAPPLVAGPQVVVEHSAGDVARRRLAAFLPRAFRRPVRENEVTRYATVFDHTFAASGSFDEAMRVAVQAVLSSPSFLFLAEPTVADAGRIRPLNNHELANRLSYFLWSSMPDEELFRLADTGRLREPAVLEAQTRRMLRDPKARELSESFAVQWLRLDQAYTARPDRKKFQVFYSGPQGKGTLHASMLVEPLLLFETIMTEDRSILELIDADYTWVNPRLAAVYGFGEGGDLLAMADASAGESTDPPGRELPKEADVTEKTWVRVPVPDRTRGGVLTMAGPLTITSLPGRTSPVKRGAWLLETILNRPPKEPKVAVPPLDRPEVDDSHLTVRRKLELHRADTTCAVCHDRIDPPGFALEAFDAIGRFRTTEGDEAVDATGVLPDGRSFDGPAELKDELLAQRQEFTRAFIEHLASYGLGRKLDWYDVPTIEKIEDAVAADEHRFSRVVVEIVLSEPFRTVRNEWSQNMSDAAVPAAKTEE